MTLFFITFSPTYSMSTLLRHTHALQATGATALLTAAVMALPLLAADQYDEPYYAGQVVSIFQKMGAQGNLNIYNNGSLTTSAFDFAMYFSDTCYRLTDFDIPGCKEKFGPYANLKTTYDSGQLAAIFRRYNYLAGIVPLLPQSATAMNFSSSSSSVSSAPSTFTRVQPSPTFSSSSSVSNEPRENRGDRGSQLWAICTKRFSNRGQASYCYQRNIRMIMERTENITEDLVY